MGEGGSKVQTSSYKIKSPVEHVMISMATTVNSTLLYI